MKLIDVGAADEILPRFSKIKDKTVIAFEPEEKAFKELSQRYSSDNYIILQEALSKKKQEVELKLTKKRQCSSLLEPNMELLNTFPASERFEVEARERFMTDSLDNVLEKNKIFNPNFIKLDIQGAELEVLQGAPKTLEKIACIELEIAFSELYMDQPLFSEIELYLREFNFEVWDIRRDYQKLDSTINIGTKKGKLTSGDALFFKKPSELVKNNKFLSELDFKKLIRNSFMVSEVYGFSDYSFTLLEHSKDFYSKDELKEFESYFYQKQRLTTKSFLSSQRYTASLLLSSLLNKLAYKTEPYDSVGKIGDRLLGS
jgi:FkbM family methyltransferase